MSDNPKTVLTKKVLDRPLHWTGTEWHPAKERAIQYDTVGEAWEALIKIVGNEGYSVEEA